MNTLTNCKICGKKLHGRQSRYCSLICKNHSLQSYSAQKRRGIKRKLELIKRHGSKCTVCGYKKNLAALTFHHQNATKTFKLDMRSLSNRKLDRVLLEVSKCTLICQNCHAELHNKHLDLAKLLTSSRTLYH